jgi:hypothetical protein
LDQPGKNQERFASCHVTRAQIKAAVAAGLEQGMGVLKSWKELLDSAMFEIRVNTWLKSFWTCLHLKHFVHCHSELLPKNNANSINMNPDWEDKIQAENCWQFGFSVRRLAVAA